MSFSPRAILGATCQSCGGDIVAFVEQGVLKAVVCRICQAVFLDPRLGRSLFASGCVLGIIEEQFFDCDDADFPSSPTALCARPIFPVAVSLELFAPW